MTPFFTPSPLWLEKTGKIYALLERVKISEEQSKDVLHLRRTNRILTIGSTTAIEGNRLTTQQVFDVINGKVVFAPLHDIKEVKNAFSAYEQIPDSMYQYIDSATGTNHMKNDPVNIDFDPVNDPVNSFDVLELIKANPHRSYEKLVEKTGRSRATIKRMIKRLKQEGYISRIGSDKTGYWEVNIKNLKNE